MCSKSWGVYYGSIHVSLTDEEYTELRRLAVVNPSAAEAKCREYVKREREEEVT